MHHNPNFGMNCWALKPHTPDYRDGRCTSSGTGENENSPGWSGGLSRASSLGDARESWRHDLLTHSGGGSDDPPTEIGKCLEISKAFMQVANSSILRPVIGVVISVGYPRRKSLQHFLHLGLLVPVAEAQNHWWIRR
jgi:hypothetical protein